MTDELKPCLTYPCDGHMKGNSYDVSLECSSCQFVVADDEEYAALVAGKQAAIDDEKQNPWKAAIIDELIVDCIYSKEHESDPRKALAEAIEWNCKIALDPTVSAEARALQQEAIDAALSDLIYDLGGVTDKGPWTPSDDGRHIQSEDFEHDVTLRVSGDFATDEDRIAYTKWLGAKLNTAPQVPDGMVLVGTVIKPSGGIDYIRWNVVDESIPAGTRLYAQIAAAKEEADETKPAVGPEANA